MCRPVYSRRSTRPGITRRRTRRRYVHGLAGRAQAPLAPSHALADPHVSGSCAYRYARRGKRA